MNRQEGFICPACKTVFMDPVQLQSHFETAHSSEASISAAKKTEGHMVDLKGEVSELQSTIREEQQYSNRYRHPRLQ